MDFLSDESDVMTTSMYHSNGSNGSSQHLNGSASREEAKQVPTGTK